MVFQRSTFYSTRLHVLRVHFWRLPVKMSQESTMIWWVPFAMQPKINTPLHEGQNGKKRNCGKIWASTPALSIIGWRLVLST